VKRRRKALGWMMRPGVKTAAVSGENAMSNDLQSRMDAMYARDRMWAYFFVVALWIVVLFVLFAVRRHINDGAIEFVCWVAAGLLLLFNTASIMAMVRHYGEDKEHVYGIDIKHLDAGH
jgi:hypothetical protein